MKALTLPVASINKWIKKNQKLSLIIWISLFFILMFLGIIIGLAWDFSDLYFPEFGFKYTWIALLSIGILLYPSKKHIKKNIFSWRQYFHSWKIFDLCLVLSMSLMAIGVGHDLPNKSVRHYPIYQVTYSALTISTEANLHVLGQFEKPHNRKGKWFKKVQLWHDKIIAHAKRIYTDFKQKENNYLGLAIVGAFLLLLVLQISLTIGACALACGGAGAAAILVFAGGSGLVLFLAFTWFKAIFENQTKLKGSLLKDRAWRTTLIFLLLELILVGIDISLQEGGLLYYIFLYRF